MAEVRPVFLTEAPGLGKIYSNKEVAIVMTQQWYSPLHMIFFYYY